MCDVSELSAIRSKLGVRSVQQGSITVTNSTGGTAALTTVSTGRTFVLSGGLYTTNSSGTMPAYQAYLDSATSVRVDMATTTLLAATFRYAVVEMKG